MSNEDEKKHHLIFSVNVYPDGIFAKDAPEETNMCDSIVQIVMDHERDKGRKHYCVMSMDGERGEQLNLREQWEAWYILGRFLASSMDADDVNDGWMQQIADGVIEVCDVMKKGATKKVESCILDSSGKKIVH